MPPLTPEEAGNLVNAILYGPSINKASALFTLLKIVSDPHGDSDKYESAISLLRATDPLTKEYDAWFQGRINSAEPAIPLRMTA